jgi:uncharacterized membrane protein YhaH (DUF805 family)
MMDLLVLLTRFRGRTNRLGFWIGALITGVATGLLLMAVQWLLRPVAGPAAVLVIAVMCWPLAAVFAKRLHDRNRRAAPWIAVLLAPNILRRFVELGLFGGPWTGPAWWMLVGASAVTSVWILVDLGLMPGTDRLNAWGPPPDRLSN